MESTEIVIDERTKNRAHKKVIMELNDFGHRLFWVRTKLNLGACDVQNGSGLPPSTLSDWEAGVRTGYWEALLSLATYYGELWRIKFSDHFPLYQAEQVKEISFQFLVFGKDKTKEELRDMTASMSAKIKEMEMRFAMEKAELNQQLDWIREQEA